MVLPYQALILRFQVLASSTSSAFDNEEHLDNQIQLERRSSSYDYYLAKVSMLLSTTSVTGTVVVAKERAVVLIAQR